MAIIGTRATTWRVLAIVIATRSTTWNVASTGGTGPLDSFSVYVWTGSAWTLQANQRRTNVGTWV
jgi:hypothetical protein